MSLLRDFFKGSSLSDERCIKCGCIIASMFEEGRYAGQSSAEIKRDLQEQGHAPILITNAANSRLEVHSHPQLHILVVVEGEMRLELDGESPTMRPGDKIIIEPNQIHAAHFGPQGCQYFWIEE